MKMICVLANCCSVVRSSSWQVSLTCRFCIMWKYSCNREALSKLLFIGNYAFCWLHLWKVLHIICINANTLIVFRSENKYVCLHKIWFCILWKRFLLLSWKIAVTLGREWFVNCAKHVMERTELNLDSWVERWGKVNTFSSKGQRDSSREKIMVDVTLK